MTNPEFEAKMQRIIRQSQQLFVTDAEQRIETALAALAEWQSGVRETAAATEAIHMQVHAMKGVALTIHFEPMHRICEAILAHLEQQNLQEAETLIGGLPEALQACRAIMSEPS